MKQTLAGWLRKRKWGSRLLALWALAGPDSYLIRTGWFDTYFKSMPVDAEGRAIPWYTYPAIAFLKERLHPGMSVLEYGSGNSTLWWSERVVNVISCEHDADWYKLMQPKLPTNVEYLCETLEEGRKYANAISRFPQKFDIVIIDGRDRVNCARNSVGALAPSGVIIWDNSDRDEYREGFLHLAEHGFRRLDFWGAGPINAYSWCTSILYRDGNCLRI